MLHAAPTKKGTGIEIFGHTDDLENLHQTIHYLCEGNDGMPDEHEHALSVAYELRKAYERQREERKTEFGTLLGTFIDWPQIVFYTSYFRHLAAFRPTTKELQSNLSRLEFCVESALLQYDPKVGAEVIELYPMVGAVSRDFYPSYVPDVTYTFLYQSGTGKMRFRRLPALIKSMSAWSDEYREYAEMLEQEAKKHGCSPYQLHDSREWPEIQW